MSECYDTQDMTLRTTDEDVMESMDVRRSRSYAVKKSLLVSAAVAIIMVVMVMVLAVERVDASVTKRASVGMVVYTGFESHGFDVAEVAMEMVSRGYDAFVSLASHDVKPFMRYITQSGRHVDVQEYVGDVSEAAYEEADAKLWLVRSEVEKTMEMMDFERAWLRDGPYTRERTVDDMKRDYFLRFIQEASELNDPMKSTSRILEISAHSCRSMMQGGSTSQALASVDMMIVDAACTCGWFQAVRFKVRCDASPWALSDRHFPTRKSHQKWNTLQVV